MDLLPVQNHNIHAITICNEILIIGQASIYYYFNNNLKRGLITLTPLAIVLKYFILLRFSNLSLASTLLVFRIFYGVYQSLWNINVI